MKTVLNGIVVANVNKLLCRRAMEYETWYYIKKFIAIAKEIKRYLKVLFKISSIIFKTISTYN